MRYLFIIFSNIVMFSLQPIAENIVLAVNQEYIDTGDIPLTFNTGDEVAVIPPISGG